MTARPMEGVRVVEVAQFTFVPASGAVLSDWGADVIKVEHAVTGDAQRGLKVGIFSAVGPFAPIMEHPNRNKRSIGLDLETPEGLEILYDLVRDADVFSTNFLPAARRRLKIEVDDIRKVNPKIVYLRGSALGARGPECENGGFDASTYWFRGGSAVGVTPSDLEGICALPAPSYGDSIGAVFMAGGVAAALFARERTGEGSVVDASLLSTAAWAMALTVSMSLMTGESWAGAPGGKVTAPPNPIATMYRTADRRWIQLSMLQAGRYWADFCRHIEREDLIGDSRFDTVEKLHANASAAQEIVAEEMEKRTLAEWRECFRTLEGQWSAAQTSYEVGHDPQLRANGFIADVVDVSGVTRQLVAAPVQFDETPAQLRRAPQFAEHTDEILRELGLDDERIMELKIAGAVT